MKPVLCFGDICPDMVIPYGAALQAGKAPCEQSMTGNVTSVRVFCGGSVANTCVGLLRQGIPAMFCGSVADDSLGRMLYDDLVSEGADVSMLKKRIGGATVLILVVKDESGDRVTFAYPKTGASQHNITSDQIPDDVTRHISWLHCGGITLREEPAASVQLDLMERCKSAGIPISFDVNTRIESISDRTFAENVRHACRLCTVLLGSAEAELLPLCDGRGLSVFAGRFTRQNRVMVARRGENGADVFHGGTYHHQDAFPVRQINTIGAGDAYDAGYIAAALHGGNPVGCNAAACATAAFCVAGEGARSTPTADELQLFMQRYSDFCK